MQTIPVTVPHTGGKERNGEGELESLLAHEETKCTVRALEQDEDMYLEYTVWN